MHLLCLFDLIQSDIITPALDRVFGIQSVTLLVAKERIAEAQDVAAVARVAGLSCQVEPLGDSDAVDDIRQQLAALIQAQSEAVMINLSGASPILAALGQEVALRLQIPSFAIHPEHDTLIWLNSFHDASLPAGGHQIADRLDLRSYFALHGCQLDSCSVDLQQRNPVLERAARHLAHFGADHPRDLFTLMRSAQHADEDGFTNVIAAPIRVYLHALEEAGLINLLSDGRMRLRDNQARNFFNGGWLEYWLFGEAVSLVGKLPIHAVGSGVTIRTAQGVKNEFDLALLCNNQLFLVECKAREPKLASHNLGVGMDTLFKLDSVKQIAEIDARAMLASLAKPTLQESSRAEEQDIELVSGHELLHIRKHLESWLREAV